jgi:hypothetical protein
VDGVGLAGLIDGSIESRTESNRLTDPTTPPFHSHNPPPTTTKQTKKSNRPTHQRTNRTKQKNKQAGGGWRPRLFTLHKGVLCYYEGEAVELVQDRSRPRGE